MVAQQMQAEVNQEGSRKSVCFLDFTFTSPMLLLLIDAGAMLLVRAVAIISSYCQLSPHQPVPHACSKQDVGPEVLVIV